MNTNASCLRVAILLIVAGIAVQLSATCVTDERKPSTSSVRQILDDKGKPIGAADVFVRPAEYKDARATSLKTDSEGFLRLSLNPGKYWVLVKARGFLNHQYLLVVKKKPNSTATTLRLTPSSECHDMNVAHD